ncbi:MAG: hypothetical protein KBG40_00570 [Bacteroidales bacterium]|nr:hypothetical protein [Bacteroidales bacterium]
MNQISSHPLYRRHDLDSAMRSLWLFYKSRFLPLFIISLVMSLITQYISTLINISEFQNVTDPEEILALIRSNFIPLLGLAAVSLWFSIIYHYYVLFKPIDESCNIFVCILKSLNFIIPYFIIIILFAFAGSFVVAAGLLLLIVGVFFAALYLGMISLFILPVMITEGNDIGKVIVHTIKLSHTNFWPNLGWTAVFFLLYIVISLILSGLTMAIFSGSFLSFLSNPTEANNNIADVFNSPLYIILSAVVNALLLPLIPIFSFILYFNGRAAEEPFKRTSDEEGSENKLNINDLYSLPRNEEKEDENI